MRMLGDKLLPDSVNARRRQVRQKLNDVRRPLRQRRLQYVPGPDVVGKVESKFADLRDMAVSRTSVMSRIRERRSDSSGSESGSSNGGGSSGGSSSSSSNNGTTQIT